MGIATTEPPTPAAAAPVARRAAAIRIRACTVALIGAVSLPLVCALVGAVCARPIADDYVVQGYLQVTHTGVAAFRAWMENWTAYYSTYGLMTAAAVAGRHVGIAVQYAGQSVLLLVLLVGAASLGCRSWWRHVRPQLSLTLVTALVIAGLLGSFDDFGMSGSPALFGALYWAPAWMSHLVPILLLPLALAAAVRCRRRRAAAGYLVVGLILGGFGFSESGIVVAASGATGWAIWRFYGSARVRGIAPALIGLAAGATAGTLIVWRLPGTADRAHRLGQGIHLTPVGPLVETILRRGGQDFFSMLASPAPLLGLVIGFSLQRLGTRGGGGVSRETASYLEVVTKALGATTVAAWLCVTVGDAASYFAYYHMYPLWVLCYVFFLLLGWQLGARQVAPMRSLAVGLVGASIVWSSLLTGFATSAVWARRPVFDRDLAAARSASHTRQTVVWRSVSIGDIRDAQRVFNPWVKSWLAQWTGLSEDQLVIRELPPRTASISLPIPTRA